MVDNALFASSILSNNKVHLVLLLYTDPGAGALMWQLVLASLVGGAFYARHLIQQVKTRFAGSKKNGSAYQVSLSDGIVQKRPGIN